MMSGEAARPLHSDEKRVIEAMLVAWLGSAHSYKQRLEQTEVIDCDETLFRFVQSGSSEVPSKRSLGVPVEGLYRDADGVAVYIDLFVDDADNLVELELWKGDGSPIQLPYTQADLEIRPLNRSIR